MVLPSALPNAAGAFTATLPALFEGIDGLDVTVLFRDDPGYEDDDEEDMLDEVKDDCPELTCGWSRCGAEKEGRGMVLGGGDVKQSRSRSRACEGCP